jgi:hypothetical protein
MWLECSVGIYEVVLSSWEERVIGEESRGEIERMVFISLPSWYRSGSHTFYTDAAHQNKQFKVI